jgi:hypothetical protein
MCVERLLGYKEHSALGSFAGAGKKKCDKYLCQLC